VVSKVADVAGINSYKSQKRGEDHILLSSINRQITPSSALPEHMSEFAIISAAI
jgi:hypothetical protein